VISGICVTACVYVSACVFPFWKENGVSYQHQTWYTYSVHRGQRSHRCWMNCQGGYVCQ